jgi:hypothetical protein
LGEPGSNPRANAALSLRHSASKRAIPVASGKHGPQFITHLSIRSGGTRCATLRDVQAQCDRPDEQVSFSTERARTAHALHMAAKPSSVEQHNSADGIDPARNAPLGAPYTFASSSIAVADNSPRTQRRAAQEVAVVPARSLSGALQRLAKPVAFLVYRRNRRSHGHTQADKRGFR